MKAVALMRYLAISDPESLIDVELEKPIPSGHDLLVRIKAIGMNPLDTKVRAPKVFIYRGKARGIFHFPWHVLIRPCHSSRKNVLNSRGDFSGMVAPDIFCRVPHKVKLWGITESENCAR